MYCMPSLPCIMSCSEFEITEILNPEIRYHAAQASVIVISIDVGLNRSCIRYTCHAEPAYIHVHAQKAIELHAAYPATPILKYNS